MYYNLYHASNLRKIIRFLRKIESIEFECNIFILVLVQIDLIHFEHIKCISSTSIKTNTNPSQLRLIHTILCKIRHVIQNRTTLKRFRCLICISLIWTEMQNSNLRVRTWNPVQPLNFPFYVSKKISRTLFDFLYNTYLVSLFYRNSWHGFPVSP